MRTNSKKRKKKKNWYTDKIKDCFLSRVCFGVFIFIRWIFLSTEISGLFYSDFKLNWVYIWRLTFNCKKLHPKTLFKKPSNYSWQFLVKCSFIIAREYEKEHAEHQTLIYFNTPILENIPLLFMLNSNSMVQWLCYAFCSKLKSLLSFGSCLINLYFIEEKKVLMPLPICLYRFFSAIMSSHCEIRHPRYLVRLCSFSSGKPIKK